MAMYDHKEVEQKWQQYWEEQKIYQVEMDAGKPKYYVLDMFPYPSGAGLHVGHPLGYIASDIVSRFKKLKGFNVLHPMGFDSFGLPAEQYAIDTGQHPAITTEQNIATFKRQLGKIGFSFDWSREVRTSDPAYYRWTQWIFGQLFNSWYNNASKKAEPIETLIAEFEQNGNATVRAACDEDTPSFTAEEWKAMDEKAQAQTLLTYRLTFLAYAEVNWCPALGTVLANDEVKDGFSERGGHPVERKKMRQWMMRITAYADRLLKNLDSLDWSDSLKEMQRNWIGKSHGCELDFAVVGQEEIKLTAFTTRPDTIFGVTFMVMAPEHELIDQLVTEGQKAEVAEYVTWAKNRSERERMTEVKKVTGVFTGAYVKNPLTDTEVPLWVADYVLAGYGTGVVMAVPSSDDRDFRFANHFDLPVIRVIQGSEELEDPTEVKKGKMVNSGFLNGLKTKDAIKAAIAKAKELGVGKGKTNFKIRDAVFSRQRYWGEPVPVHFRDDIPYLLTDAEMPLELPAIDEYKPTEDGEPPLARAKDWKHQGQHPYELTTMPGWAGSSWYFLRYMDPQNADTFCDRQKSDYWNSVDLYIGGTEHATGHLLYSRFWTLFLHDRGHIGYQEPFQKLVNQGMIQGRSSLVYKLKSEDRFVSLGLRDQHDCLELHVDVKLVSPDDTLDIEAFKAWRPEYANAAFDLEDGKYKCGHAVEKMSKRWYNVVNPDDICEQYGADTLRLYEMFLGPLEQSKPWNTQGIDGVSRFLKKLWKLFHTGADHSFQVSEGEPTKAELKILHKTLKKIESDIEALSLNTCVSEFMICVNQLSEINCTNGQILSELVTAVSPFAPHICEELWAKLGHVESITHATYPAWNAEYLREDSYKIAVQVNGKVRETMEFGMDMSKADIEAQVLANETIQKWMDGKSPRKVIVVPKKIVNVVV